MTTIAQLTARAEKKLDTQKKQAAKRASKRIQNFKKTVNKTYKK
jgi:hypothetical protein